ncbi:cyclic nucleotide-binding domain-containing protein [Thermodesulfobacteriota bacterium]
MDEETIHLLKKVPIFSGFDEGELSTLTKFLNLYNVNKGEVLFNDGDTGDYVCFVLDGRLDVCKRTMVGGDLVLNTLSRGQSFGEMALIENEPRSAMVRASVQTIYVTLSKKDFDSILEEHPRIGIKILKGISLLLSRKLRSTSSRLFDYMSKAH